MQILVKVPSRKITCHQDPFERLKKIKKVPKKKKDKFIFKELCSAVSALFMHCKSFTSGSEPKKKNKRSMRSSPEESDFALAKEK